MIHARLLIAISMIFTISLFSYLAPKFIDIANAQGSDTRYSTVLSGEAPPVDT